MVRSHIWRRKKYEAKIDGTVAELRIDAERDAMIDAHTAITSILVENEIQAKETILEPNGIGTVLIPFYLNAMREFCKCTRNFTSVTRDNKCYFILLRYRDKGLLNNILVQLSALCGCNLWGYYTYP